MRAPPSEPGRPIPFPGRGREPWATKGQVAEHFQVCEKTVDRWVKAGMPSLSGRGRTVRYRVGDCEAWLGAAS